MSAFTCLPITSGGNFISGLDIRRCAVGIDINMNGLLGNVIGIDISAPSPLPSERNILRENGIGLRLTNAGGNVVYGNFIGTDPLGSSSIGNTTGIALENAFYDQIGFSGTGRNVISGNTDGIYLGPGSFGTGIGGNYIGTDPAGTGPLGNSNGILIQDGNLHFIQSNVISGNSTGIYIVPTIAGNGMATGNVIQRNLIGTDVNGASPITNGAGVILFHAPGNLIGGTSGSDGNVISGNAEGIVIAGSYATRNLIQGNLIGTNGLGTSAVANGTRGIRIDQSASSNLIGGATANSRNVISGNAGEGVLVDTFSPGNATYLSTDVPKTIPDLSTITSVIQVPETARINDLNVTLDITHTFDGDLAIALTSPDNVTIDLSSNNGGAGDDYTNTTFDDEAGTLITAGVPPFT
ncbi:MAG: proprotein convertase P-domain-containing protein, partial [Gammaproteobacteria bacterium]